MTNEERQVEIERIITNLNIIAPKNPRSDWGRIQKKDIDEACCVLRNAIIIPDNATNGDMIMAMFPNGDLHDYYDGYVIYEINYADCKFDKNWWNAPYKK